MGCQSQTLPSLAVELLISQGAHDLLKRHLANPIRGVYALDRELFLYLRGHAGHAETERAFEEAERRRAQGRTYTKSDYLIEHQDDD
jgi:hypothetical protein